ncbi:MAG TPA: hypothetical protein VFZ65_06675 [Planctomycetota bacterium]|nr:hypothetical protein [Planctomycetota bacterium]
MRAWLPGCSLSTIVLVVAVACGPIATAVGQCTTQWLPGHGIPGTSSLAYAATWWQPNVGGLQHPQIVVAGIFDRAGTVSANNVAAFDVVTHTWTALGAGLPGVIFEVAVLPNGDLIAGGFNNPFLNNLPYGVYVWNGATWAPLAGGVNGTVTALEVLRNGDLIVAGAFTQAGSVAAPYIARWDGVNWHSLGQGTQGPVSAVAEMANGDLAVSESFSTTLLPWSPGWVVRIHRWDGANWSLLAQPSLPVQCLAALPNGDLVAGGTFTDIGTCVARWDGTGWTDLAGSVGGLQPVVEGLVALGNGDLIATGRFTFLGGVAAAYVARWDGVGWSPMGNGLDGVGASGVELPTGDVALVGNFTTAGSVEASCVALWDGVEWRAPGAALDGSVRALALAANGDLLAGGAFTSGLGTTLRGIGRWDGAAWHALGGGVTGGEVRAMVQLGNGDVVAAGAFPLAGSTPVGGVARWDGATWSALGSGLGGVLVPVGNVLAALQSGDVVVAGDFATAGGVPASAIARWNGAAWASLGTGLQGGTLGAPVAYALATMPNGDLVVGGRFQSAGGVPANGIARWNGATWSAMGGGIGGGPIAVTVRSLALLPNGDLVAGSSTSASGWGVARWDGTQWTSLGAPAGTVQSVVALPNGDVVAGGQFASGDAFLRRSNGVWLPFVAGQTAVDVHAMQMLPDGELAIAADFAPQSGEFWSRILRVATTCPAVATMDGVGCSGTGGVNRLTAATLPWLASTFRADATGLAGNALAVSVLGLGNPFAPLSSLLSQGLPGCTLYVTPDLLSLYVPSGGNVQLPIVIPNTISLATQTFRQQVVAFELATSGVVTGVTSSNALSLTIGAF